MSILPSQMSFGQSVLPTVQVSVGELFDKKTILEIKARKLTNPQQLRNVLKELETLSKSSDALSKECDDPNTLAELVAQLQQINARLWDLENKVRQHLRNSNVGVDFVNAAKQIFTGNDERARTKRAINELMHSFLIEEKFHA